MIWPVFYKTSQDFKKNTESDDYKLLQFWVRDIYSNNRNAIVKFEEYRKYDALELAVLVINKEVKPSEFLDIAIQRTMKSIQTSMR